MRNWVSGGAIVRDRVQRRNKFKEEILYGSILSSSTIIKLINSNVGRAVTWEGRCVTIGA